jgi:hypothetical protein
VPSNSTDYAGEPINVGPFVITKRGNHVTVQARGYKAVAFQFDAKRVTIATDPDGEFPQLSRRGGTIYAVAASSEKLDTDLPKRLN